MTSTTTSPNCSGTLKDPRYIVVHYTASGNFASTRDWLCNPSAKVSAHLLIGREPGEVVQLVPFNKRAWHAGLSRYKGLAKLNEHSIGIELVSWGPLELSPADGKYYARGTKYVVPASEVHDGAPPEGGARYWQTYTKTQLVALAGWIRALRTQFPSIEEVIGHRDISGHRGKQDPWPLDLSKYQG